MLVEILPHNIDDRLIEQAVDVLKKGELIIFPTDSVYAVGCDLYNKKALKKLAEFKSEKLKKTNFSIICHDIKEISDYVKQIDRRTFKLLNKSLPGPFTFILSASNDITKLFESNRKEIGVRIPNSPVILEIVKKLGNPIATTSLHDKDDEIKDYFIDPYKIYERYDNQVAMIIDGGKGNLEPSTVVRCIDEEYEIIRQGVGEIDL